MHRTCTKADHIACGEARAPVAKNALQNVLRDIVRRTLAAIDDAVTPAAVAQESDMRDCIDPGEIAAPDATRPRAITTDRELDCFAIVKGIFDASSFARSLIFDPSQWREVPIEIGYKVRFR